MIADLSSLATGHCAPEPAALRVLARYPLIGRNGELVALDSRGGFSGSRIWRVKTAVGDWCLKGWPPGDPTPARLEMIHCLMLHARQAGCVFVPAVVAALDGPSQVEQEGWLWDLTSWMPGRPDFHECPSAARMESACTALAMLHDVWARITQTTGPCPGIQRRLQAAQAWTTLVASGWRPMPRKGGGVSDPFACGLPITACGSEDEATTRKPQCAVDECDGDPAWPWAQRAWRLLPFLLTPVLAEIRPWAERTLPLQPCLGDVWHNNLLFEEEALTGLVDYGGVQVDHVATDLARLLGSLAGDEAELRDVGLRAYARLRPLTLEEEQLVGVLDRSGTVLSVANWLRWLYHEGRSFPDGAAVAGRLEELVTRITRDGCGF